MMKHQFRMLHAFTSTIFIYAGMKHLINPAGIFKRVSSATIYMYLQNESIFRFFILLSGVAMIVAGTALMVGYKTRSAAVILLAVLISITLTTQLENLGDLGPFFKNVAIAGSLLFIINRKKHENKILSNRTDRYAAQPDLHSTALSKS